MEKAGRLFLWSEMEGNPDSGGRFGEVDKLTYSMREKTISVFIAGCKSLMDFFSCRTEKKKMCDLRFGGLDADFRKQRVLF